MVPQNRVELLWFDGKEDEFGSRDNISNRARNNAVPRPKGIIGGPSRCDNLMCFDQSATQKAL
jgi:hypothetical protein